MTAERQTDLPERVAYTAEEFAEMTGVSYWTVCRMARKGQLARVSMGKRKNIPAYELERFKAKPEPSG